MKPLMPEDILFGAVLVVLVVTLAIGLSGCGKITHEVTGGVDDPTVHTDPIVIATPNWLIELPDGTLTLPTGNYTISGNTLIISR